MTLYFPLSILVTVMIRKYWLRLCVIWNSYLELHGCLLTKWQWLRPGFIFWRLTYLLPGKSMPHFFFWLFCSGASEFLENSFFRYSISHIRTILPEIKVSLHLQYSFVGMNFWILRFILPLFWTLQLIIRQVFHDGLRNGVETRHSISLCLLFCPIGIIAHAITKGLTKSVKHQH